MTPDFSKGLKPGLYAITDSTLTPADSLLEQVEAALRGGTVLLQYREKRAPEPERLCQARNLQAACANAGVPLIINDDPLLARRVGAAGVHLGQGDTSLTEARQLLGDDAIIGITCHDSLALANWEAGHYEAALEEGRRLVALHPDYLTGHLYVAMSAVSLGRIDEARAAIAAGRRARPDLSIELMQNYLVVSRPTIDAKRNTAPRLPGND